MVDGTAAVVKLWGWPAALLSAFQKWRVGPGDTTSDQPIVFLWENLGPNHIDRCEAAARFFGRRRVFAIELFSESRVYDWERSDGNLFATRTLFGAGEHPGYVESLRRMIGAARSIGRGCYFLCHYENPDILMFAWWLRLTGSRVFMMGDSKYDDFTRHLWREVAKRLFVMPYQGALAAADRSADYLRFLGVPEDSIEVDYDCLSVDRIRSMAGVAPAPDGPPFADRHFIAVARLVPKKNLGVLLEAYALYRARARRPRALVLCGSGVLEADLRAQAARLRIGDHVRFEGFVQTDVVSRLLGSSIALLLPSVEEQFGLAVIEAQAMGLPVILSDNCGSRDRLVRTGINGFVVESDNVEGLAFFMELIGDEEATWRRMAIAACDGAMAADSERFAEAVLRLLSAEAA